MNYFLTLTGVDSSFTGGIIWSQCPAQTFLNLFNPGSIVSGAPWAGNWALTGSYVFHATALLTTTFHIQLGGNTKTIGVSDARWSGNFITAL
jgi:hypothetical protein